MPVNTPSPDKHRFSPLIEKAFLILLVGVFGTATYYRNADWKTEQTLWSDAVLKAPGKARTHNNLAVTFNETGQYRNALEEALVTKRLRPDDVRAAVIAGDAFLRLGDPDRAFDAYADAVRNLPSYADGWLGIGTVHAIRKDFARAADAFKKASELKPQNLIARLNLASAYGSMGKPQAAIDELLKALSMSPDNPDLHYNLGIAYESLARSESVPEESRAHLQNALKHFSAAVSINPNDADAGLRLRQLQGILR